MNVGTVRSRPAWTTLLQATGIYLLSMLLHRGILNAQGRSPEAALPAAIVLAIGIFGTAATLWRNSAIPSWSRFASGGVFAIALVASALLAPEAFVSRKADSWMLPWVLLIMSFVTPSRRTSSCVREEFVGRMTVGVSSILAVAYVIAAMIDARR